MAKTTSDGADAPKNKWQRFSEENAATADHDDVPSTEDAVDSVEHNDPSPTHTEAVEALQQQVDQLQAAVKVADEKVLRAMAQLKNAQDRAERDVVNAHKFGTEKLINDLLPVVDSLLRGLESMSDESPAAKEGLQLTLDLLNKTLSQHGATLIAPNTADDFDPQWHEAMTMQAGNGIENNKIISVLQPGYALNGRVLRAARVIVSSGP